MAAGLWEEDTYTFWDQKVKITTVCQIFGSDTITWVDLNVQISYINPGWREEDNYTFLGQKVKGHNWT